MWTKAFHSPTCIPAFLKDPRRTLNQSRARGEADNCLESKFYKAPFWISADLELPFKGAHTYSQFFPLQHVSSQRSVCSSTVISLQCIRKEKIIDGYLNSAIFAQVEPHCLPREYFPWLNFTFVPSVIWKSHSSLPTLSCLPRTVAALPSLAAILVWGGPTGALDWGHPLSETQHHVSSLGWHKSDGCSHTCIPVSCWAWGRGAGVQTWEVHHTLSHLWCFDNLGAACKCQKQEHLHCQSWCWGLGQASRFLEWPPAPTAVPWLGLCPIPLMQDPADTLLDLFLPFLLLAGALLCVAVLYHQPSPLQALITVYFSLVLQPKNTFLFGLHLQGSALSGTSFILSPPPLPPPAVVLCQQHRAWGPA